MIVQYLYNLLYNIIFQVSATPQICGRVVVLVGAAHAARRVPARRLEHGSVALDVGELAPARVPGRRRRPAGTRYFQQLALRACHQPHSSEFTNFFIFTRKKIALSDKTIKCIQCRYSLFKFTLQLSPFKLLEIYRIDIYKPGLRP